MAAQGSLPGPESGNSLCLCQQPLAGSGCSDGPATASVAGRLGTRQGRVPQGVTQPSSIIPTTATLTWADRWDHVRARLGYRRSEHRVRPGLYALGRPTPESPIFVTANYTLSFDALRSALAGLNGYILVLDTEGINVWCAAAKGTFGTDEVARRVEATGLADVVRHRTLILPPLSAAGVSAHEVWKRCGFRVEYGPVRASDLPEYLETHRATLEMRRVRFDLLDRLVLIPVELVHVFLPLFLAAVALRFLGGWTAATAAVAAVLTGVVLFPILLPWLPTRDFSSKGFSWVERWPCPLPWTRS